MLCKPGFLLGIQIPVIIPVHQAQIAYGSCFSHHVNPSRSYTRKAAPSVSAGRKKAADDLQKYIESSQITIQNGYGETVSTEAFVGEALKTGSEKNQKIILVLILILGLLFLLGIAVFFYWLPVSCYYIIERIAQDADS